MEAAGAEESRAAADVDGVDDESAPKEEEGEGGGDLDPARGDNVRRALVETKENP